MRLPHAPHSVGLICAQIVVALWMSVSPVRAEEHEDQFEAPGVSSIPVSAIRFEGNKRTRERILLQEMKFRAGDTVTPAQVEEARQSIMDLGLFKRVRARTEESPEGRTLVFDVEEKFYFLPVPILNGDPNERNYSYGLELRVDNLGGYNQRVKLQYEQEHSASKEVPQQKKASVAYTYPRLLGSAYTLSLGYSLEQEDYNALDADEDVLARYHRNVTSINGGVSRWLNPEGPSRGWSGGMGLSYAQREYTLISGEPGLRDNAQAVSVTANISMRDVHDRVYYYEGTAYGWNGSLGSKLLGSDFDFTRNLFYYRVYNHFGQTRNINWQMRIGIADGEVFDAPAYSLGGFTSLRGYDDSIQGNAYALSNLEYHQQLDGYPSLRGVVFLDVGNAYEDFLAMDPGRLETGAGLGLRWRIQELVNVTLSLDAAYGFGPQEPVFYAMTSGSF